jgi:DNA-binding SARP family transcriptional activator/Cdc6-like AAA superfamily ATPase/tetratricopeptide (TPR) repeat protein
MSLPATPFLSTLGRVRLESPAGELLSGRRKELAVLVYVALSSPRGVPREELATLLWGDRDDAKARQSLRHALYYLRRVLGEVIDATNGDISVSAGAIDIDVLVFARLVSAGRPTDALALCKGEFLSGFEDVGTEEFRSWVDRERDRLRRSAYKAFEDVVSSARKERRTAEEQRWAREWSGNFPLDETAHAALIRALLSSDEVSEARNALLSFKSAIGTELGEDLSPELRLLVLEIEERSKAVREFHPGSAALFSPSLVGRDAVLEALADLSRNSASNPGVALIEGEEGFGKSRVVTEFLRRARGTTKKAIVLETRADPRDTDVPYATLRRIVRSLLEHKIIEEAPNRSLVEISRIAPELKARFPQLAVPGDDSGQIPAAFTSTLRSIAARNSLLLIVDDFARADAASQDVLLSLAISPIPSSSLILTARPDDLERCAVLREIARVPGLRRIKLQPLDDAQIKSLIDSMIQLSPEDRHTVSHRIAWESGGNPFYIVELISVLADAGMLALDSRGTWRLTDKFSAQSLPLPRTLREAIRLRLSQVSSDGRKMLDAAVSLDPVFGMDALRQAAALAPENFHSAIDELLTRRLLRFADSREAGYQFSHELIRRVVAESKSYAGSTRAMDGALRVGRRRWHVAGIALAVAASVLVVFGLALRYSRAEAGSIPESRVLVTAFVNQTGEAQLDHLGRATAEWLTRGIAQTGLVPVLPPAEAADSTGNPGPSLLPDEYPKLARRLAPSIVVSGSIYRFGDSIRFESRITDLRRGAVIQALDPVTAAVGDPMIGLDALREKLVSSLAASLDERVSGSAAVQSRTPSYAAYRIFSEALDDFYARRPVAVDRFRAAYALDSGFTLPVLYAAVTYDGMGQLNARDSMIERLAARRSELAPYDRLLFDYLSARRNGDRSGEYSAAKRAAQIAPGSFAAVFLAPRGAMQLNRPGEAVQLLSQIDRDRSAASGLPSYWNIMAHSLHMLGRYDDQLAVARDLTRRIPEETRALYYEVRALSALGRTRELDGVLSRSLSLPTDSEYGPPGMGAHQTAADELRFHGNPQYARIVLERVLLFYRSAPEAVRRIPRFQHEIAYANYELGRLAEARAIYEQLVRTKAIGSADGRVITYYLAFVAAAQGDTARAKEVVAELQRDPERNHRGLDAFFLARLAAVRGQRELAVRLLHQATSEGKTFDNTIHHLYEFERLRGYEPFEQWLRPKG